MTVICVLGMHRSGTSCLAGSLEAAGVFSGKVVEWAPHNLKGNRENLGIRNLNDAVLAASDGAWDRPPLELKWDSQHQEQRDAIIADLYRQASTWSFKDPRTLLTLPFWREGIEKLQPIGTFRHALKAAKSLHQRSRMSLRESMTLWVHYNRILLSELEKEFFPVLCFDLPRKEYLAQLENAIEYLGAKLGSDVSFSTEAAREFYETELVHQSNANMLDTDIESDSNRPENLLLLATAETIYKKLEHASGLNG